MRFRKYFILVSIFLITTLLMTLFVKGRVTYHVYYQTERDIAVGGPFELSNSTSRYALTEAIVKYKSLFFNEDLARFSSPDVVDYKGHFFTIFTPGVSFIGVPFYMFGDLVGLPQLFTFFSVALFAVLNVLLVARLARRLGAGFNASIVSGLVFLFATNALSYSLTFTQHQMGVTVILLAILNSVSKRTFLNDLLFGLLVSIGVLLDTPNLLLMAPLGLYVFFKHFRSNYAGQNINLGVKSSLVGLIIGIIPLFALFGWYNFQTTGSVTKLGQTIGRTSGFKTNQPPRNSTETAAETEVVGPRPKLNLPFQTRNQLNGLYILLLSNERSWLFYSPVLFIGFIGFFLVYKKREETELALLAVTVVAMDVIIYSMFGDPWGGWAFGARYLIPAAAVTAGGIGVVLDRFKRSIFFIVVFVLLLFYSLYVNIAGALTTNAIPPKIEAVNLGYQIPYTYKYNFQLIDKNFTSSLFYNAFLSESLPTRYYFVILVLIVSGFILAFYGLVILRAKKGSSE